MKTGKIFIILSVVILIGAALFYANYRLANKSTPESPAAASEITLELVAQGLVSPVAMAEPDDGTGRIFVADQTGLIRIINSQGLAQDSFLDLRDQLAALNANYDERGLLGLAFHPDFKNNGRFFVYYSSPLRQGAVARWDHTSRVAEFKVSSQNPNLADKNSERIIMEIDEPQANHNGGHITFGPDGYLYIPLGDGGGANDAASGHTPGLGNGQDLTKMLGKILRLNVDEQQPRAEIFAYGFRNPYHISFDSGGSGRLFVADVGQNLWEEINIVNKNGNYGWNIREGNHCFDAENPNNPPADCSAVGANGEALIEPILEYKNSGQEGGIGTAIVGGYVYRGQNLPQFRGDYIFADFSRGRGEGGSVFAATEQNGAWSFRELNIADNDDGRLDLLIKGVGQDANGELYLLTASSVGPGGQSGQIYKIVSPK